MDLDRIERERIAIEKAVKTDKLPIRGWYKETVVSTDKADHKWPIYSRKPVVDKLGAVVSADIEEYLLSAEFSFTARFKMTKEPILLSTLNELQIPPESVEKQVIHFNDTKGALFFTLDASRIGTYNIACIVPEINAMRNAIDRWAAKKKNAHSSAEEKRALYILGQIAAIRENSLSSMNVALGTLVNLVKQNEPDYWGIVEGLISGVYEPEDAMKAAKGAISVTVTERYGELKAAHDREKDTATRQ